jgi:hypothetical protein
MSVDHDDYPAKFQQTPVPREPQDSDDETASATTADADPDVVQGEVVNPDVTDTDADADADVTDEADSDVADSRRVGTYDESPVTPVRTGGAHRYPMPAMSESAVSSPAAPVPTFSPTADTPATDTPVAETPVAETPATETPAASDDDQQASWQRIKAGFVDDPRASVEEAASIVEEAAETLVATIQERERLLRSAWEGTGTDTEKLRTAFRDYHDLYDKISQL